MATVDRIIKAHRLLLFGGKGGVGKTTCATAAALHLATHAPETSLLLVSTDPAHSLFDSLGDAPIPVNLKIQELDAQKCLQVFKEQHGSKLREIAARGTFLDSEEINRFLDLSLPGLDELMAFLEISRWLQQQLYQCIIVDTAPTGHTLALLKMPEFLTKWLGAIDGMLAKHRYIANVFRHSYQHDELDIFLDELATSVRQMQEWLSAEEQCRFMVVTLAEPLVREETTSLVAELEHMKIAIGGIVVNRLYPDNACVLCNELRNRQLAELKQFAHRLARYPLWGLPLYTEEVRGATMLENFWNGALNISEITGSEKTNGNPDLSRHTAWIESVPLSPLPLPASIFLFFAGKGGVGKTTLSCATAIRLARESPGKRVLLFSTDPAHSLSACLQIQVGNVEREVVPGLTALEMDAPTEFGSFQKEYTAEVASFFHALSSNLDFTFDREVMERLIDLSPPGVEELMALIKVMEMLAQRRYDIFVLDTAPTGHLIRLLELPELADQWLKTIFGVLLKYRQLFQVPKISQRLVEISQNLKRLRSLLMDPTRSHLYVVSILTEMAWAETQDLIAACERLKISVPAIFLNQATPDSACPVCSALYRCEAKILHKFTQSFPDRQRVVIWRRQEPYGLDALENLGHILYR